MSDELREAVARALFQRRADLGDVHMGTWEDPAWSIVEQLSSGKTAEQQQQEMRDYFLADADAVIPLIRAADFEEAAEIVKARAWKAPSRATTGEGGRLMRLSSDLHDLAVQARERSPRALACPAAPGGTPRAEPRGDEEDGA